MYLNLKKTLNSIERALPQDGEPDLKKLEKAYEQTLRLRSQLLSVMYDIQQFVAAKEIHDEETEMELLQRVSKKLVTLVIPEPLPAVKELTSAVEEHWIEMIHKAIAEESKTGIPRFKKAFVYIVIEAPRGTNNKRVWDTSNRAINVVINNLKGIFFKDDDFGHMACGIEAHWGENSRTEIRICELEDLLECPIFMKNEPNP